MKSYKGLTDKTLVRTLSMERHVFFRKLWGIVFSLQLFAGINLSFAQVPRPLPQLYFPDKKISEVYRGNWENTLKPCLKNLAPANSASPHAEENRPWKVDVNGHYPGWYPGVDVKHSVVAYLACSKDLPLVLRAWELTSNRYMMKDGGIKASTMKNNPQGTWPETTIDGSVVYYPLHLVATIDYLLTGHIIFCYSQDKDWLKKIFPSCAERQLSWKVGLIMTGFC